MTVLNRNNAQAAHYARINREEWKGVGFPTLSSRVHVKDKKMVLALLEVVRCERLLDMALHGTEVEQNFISTRNMQKEPSYDQFTSDSYASTREVEAALHNAKKFLRMRREYLEKSNKDQMNVQYFAVVVAANNLVCAYVDYARALSAHEAPNLKAASDV